MDSKDVFIHNLNTIMKDRRVSRKELAKGLNVPYTTLTDWCTGRIFPRVEKINMIADYFGIKKSDLLEEMIETEDNSLDDALDAFLLSACNKPAMRNDSEFVDIDNLFLEREEKKIMKNNSQIIDSLESKEDNQFTSDELEDIFLFTKVIDKENKKNLTSSHLPSALTIAERNLGRDFLRNFGPNYYLYFEKMTLSTVIKRKREYWLVQVVRCRAEGAYSYKVRDGFRFITADWDVDGDLDEKELKKLRCLVDKKTGEYIYYPKENIFHKVIRKLWFLVCK